MLFCGEVYTFNFVPMLPGGQFSGRYSVKIVAILLV